MSSDTTSPTQGLRSLGVESHILGPLSVPEEDCFTFYEGILGFPACSRYALVPTDREGFFWLQSVDHGSLAFLLVDPFEFVDEFYVDLGDTDLVPLQASRASEIAVLAIVTLPRTPEEAPTANLQGVVTLNFSNHLGRQVVIQDSRYGTRWPLDPERLQLAS